MKRLKSSDLAVIRAQILADQNDRCLLCDGWVSQEEAVLDHDHSTGQIRGVLHRACNHSEGSVLKWAKRSRAYTPEQFLTSVLDYWQRETPHQMLHPTFKTPDDKRLKILATRLQKVTKPDARLKILTEITQIKMRKKLLTN